MRVALLRGMRMPMPYEDMPAPDHVLPSDAIPRVSSGSGEETMRRRHVRGDSGSHPARDEDTPTVDTTGVASRQGLTLVKQSRLVMSPR